MQFHILTNLGLAFIPFITKNTFLLLLLLLCILIVKKNVGVGKSCTLLWPYTEICASGFMCHQCGENVYNVGECVQIQFSASKYE